MDADNSNELIERVGKAIYENVVSRAKKRVGASNLYLERITSAFEAARSEADRLAAILLFALAEDLMLECLKQHLNPKVNGGWKSVSEGNGVIATASDRIVLLELLYWIRPRSGADLRLLKAIRNRFAHHAEVSSFDDRKIAGWVSSLTPYEKILENTTLIEKLPKQSWTNRELYLARSTSSLISLVFDLSIGPVAQQERINPQDINSASFDSQPDNMKNALRLQARILLRVATQS